MAQRGVFGAILLDTRKHSSKSAVRQEEDRISHCPRPRQGSLSHYFFGFLYDEDDESTSDDALYRSTVESSTKIFNSVNGGLFATLLLSTAAGEIPICIVTAISRGFHLESMSMFAARAAVASVLGTSVGKFVNGPVVDMLGARRTSSLYAAFLSVSLILLSAAPTVSVAVAATFFVEFFNGVQWPCCVVTLASHYRSDASGMYEGGVFATSLATRTGSLVGIPLAVVLLQRAHWRIVALIAAWIALVASSVAYFFITDSPNKVDDPQNPVDVGQIQRKYLSKSQSSVTLLLRTVPRIAWFVGTINVLPSIRHILCSGTFWIVALAHAGASMVRTSERVLGAYFEDTRDPKTALSQSDSLVVFLSLGTLAGLTIAGRMFAGKAERERKWLVSKLYILSIAACYTLALLAIPFIRENVPYPKLVMIGQVIAVAAAGFGIAVQFYHIPSLVGATFGCDKGLYSAYTDGVGYGLASLVWRVVEDSVRRSNATGLGWTYGWSAVALLLISSSVLMIEFMEHYFCRHLPGRHHETLLLA